MEIIKNTPKSFYSDFGVFFILLQFIVEMYLKYIEKNGSITRINPQALINKEKTTTSTILNKLVENGVLVKIGNGPSTRYEINK